MDIAVNVPNPAKSWRFAEHSSFLRFSLTQTPLFTRNPHSPASGPVIGFSNSLHRESNFLAI